MMEFMFSRVTMVICGAILMAAIAIPMSQMMDVDEDSRYQDMVRSEAGALDAFYDSGMDELYLNGTAILPSGSYYLTAEGYVVILHGPGDREYTAAIAHPGNGILVTYGEICTVVKVNGYLNGPYADEEVSRIPVEPEMPPHVC